MTILSLIVDFKMRRRYTDQGAGTYSKHDDLTMSFGGSSLPSVAYSKNNSYICSEHYNRINGSLTSVTMNTGDTIWTMRKQNSRLLPTKVGSGKLETSLSCDLCGNVTVIDQSGALREINNYYPYGGLMGGAVTGIQPDKYGGKELDRENGIDWYDSQARFYDQLIGRTTTMDPMAEKYYSISPYSWCADNPMRFVDNNGKDLDFLGEDKVLAFNSLKSILGEQGNYFTISDNGSVSYSTPDGVKLKGSAKTISQIIDNKSIKVRIQTTKDVVYNNHTFEGGMFNGNTYNNEDGVVTTSQVVNMRTLGKLEEMTNSKTGTLLLHEVTESYEGGKISLDNKQSAPAAYPSEVMDSQSVYSQAHLRATKQPKIRLDIVIYNRNHQRVKSYDNAGAILWFDSNGRVIQSYIAPINLPNITVTKP